MAGETSLKIFDPTVNDLKGLYPFHAFEDYELTDFLPAARGIESIKRLELMRQGTNADKFYGILSGYLDVTQTAGGKEQVIATLERGDVVGESTLLYDDPVRSAGVVAKPRSRLIVFNAMELNDLLEHYPPAGRMFYRLLARRLFERVKASNLKLANAERKNLRF